VAAGATGLIAPAGRQRDLRQTAAHVRREIGQHQLVKEMIGGHGVGYQASRLMWAPFRMAQESGGAQHRETGWEMDGDRRLGARGGRRRADSRRNGYSDDTLSAVSIATARARSSTKAQARFTS